MSIHTQREKEEVLRRRASTPARPTQRQRPPPCAREPCGGADPCGAGTRRRHPPLGQSASYHLGDTSLRYRARWSSDSEDDSECVNRVPLLGDPGVGKSSLAGIFAGISDKDDHLEEDTYERTLTVDGKDTTLLILDTWSNDKPCEDEEDGRTGGEACLPRDSAYVVVYSVSERCSFDAAAELCIALRRRRPADDVPIILVGNKSDLVRSREVALQEGRACAMVFDCKFIETSASLQHNVSELFEGVVRQIRLRRTGGSDAAQSRRGASCKRKESITQKARRFLDRLVARNNQHAAVRVRSKSCHDLAVP
ncbi:GTP-binding protein REM 1-like [Hippocampus zosterae]|uniref:GTP-binding protein REM 1-like n=1 Tax=Hippocampus zosterae TaxID=109293 RepID=UPI00223E0CF1|nr:GTP-binding protein REM 1-like [Hippocampus zosterae]